MKDKLPPLRIVEDTIERYVVADELVPGFIEARSDVQAGEPIIAGTNQAMRSCDD